MASEKSPRALVSYGPLKAGGWKLENVSLRPLREKELLVEMVASGICQTDLHFAGAESGFGMHYPRVMGHEGFYLYLPVCFESVAESMQALDMSELLALERM